jgi:hypothetical protein
VKPRTGTDKEAAGEIVRAVVAVWSASVRSVAVVAVSTNWCGSNVPSYRTDTDAHANPYLSARVTRCKHANCN